MGEYRVSLLPVTESLDQLVLVILEGWITALKWDDREHDLRPLLMEDHGLHLQNLFLQNMAVPRENLHLLLLRNVVILEDLLLVLLGEDCELVLDHDLLDNGLLVLDHGLLVLDHGLLVLDHDLLDHNLLYHHDLLYHNLLDYDLLDHHLLDHDFLALSKKECQS
jgi:hypothetical protein